MAIPFVAHDSDKRGSLNLGDVVAGSKSIRRLSVFFLILILSGCTGKRPPNHMEELAAISSPFWNGGLPEYAVVDSDVVMGLGGRWVSVRFERRDGFSTTRAEINERIVAAQTENGWSKTTTVNDPLSRVWKQSPDDLMFDRRPRPDEKVHSFYHQRIYLSPDASVVCVYAEVGW